VFLSHSENLMFRVDTGDSENCATSGDDVQRAFFLLRIHQPIAQFCDLRFAAALRYRIWQQYAVIESEFARLTFTVAIYEPEPTGGLLSLVGC